MSPVIDTFETRSGMTFYTRKEVGKMMKLQQYTLVDDEIWISYGNVNWSNLYVPAPGGKAGAIFKAVRHEYYNPTHFATKREALAHIMKITS